MQTNTDFLKIEHPHSLEELYKLQPFNTLIISYSADTPVGTTIEIKARVRRVGDGFSKWFSWGIWSPFCDRHSINDEDDLAAMDTDTLTMKGDYLADTVQLRIITTPNEAGERPTLRNVVLASKNTQKPSQEPLNACEDVSVETPSYSQMVRDPSMAKVICSATTISMLLNQKGENVLPEEIALNNYDSAYHGCGNWSFSTAIAAAYGYDAYVRYATLNDLVDEIKHGNAVGISVSYTNDADNPKHPYVESAPCTTPGHLLVLCGFRTASNGAQYAIVHDPAAKTNDGVERLYLLDQFLAAWRNRVTYIVRKPQEQRPIYRPSRIRAALKSTGATDTYALTVDGERVLLDQKQQDGFAATSAQWIVRASTPKDADSLFAFGTVTAQGDLHLPDYSGQPLFVITGRGVTYEINR